MYALDFLYTFIYKHSIPRNKVSYILSQKMKNIDYIFLGSSRVDNFIDSEIIKNVTGKSALNLGFQAAKLDDYYFILRLLQEQKITSRIVFIQIDYVYNLDGTSEILKSSLMPYIYDDLIASYIKKRDKDFIKLKYLPFYRYMVYDYKLGFRELFNSFIQKKPRVNLANGYNPKYETAVEALKSSFPAQIINENRTITQINYFAEKNDIQIIYFTSPMCANTKNLDYTSKLSSKLSQYLDFSQIFIDHDEYFFNCSHINDDGAKVFSEKFGDIIKNKYQ